MREDRKRLFTALELSGPWLAGMEETQKFLRKEGVKARFVPPERMHLTLNFLGETDRSDQVLHELDRLPRPQEIRIAAGPGGLFIRQRGGDLIVRHIKADRALMDYQNQERGVLEALGFSMNRRPYRPHLTLARDAGGAFLKSDRFQEAFLDLPPMLPSALILYWSRFAAGRLIYTPLRRFNYGAEGG